MRILRHFLSLLTAIMLLSYPRPVKPAGEVQVALLGDIMLGRGIAQAHDMGDWGTALQVLQPTLAAADIVIANLESPLTYQPLQKTTYDLRGPFEAAEALSLAGIHYVSLSNNHSLDTSSEGLMDTRYALMARGISWAGPEPEPILINVKDRMIAWLAFDDVSQPINQELAVNTIARVHKAADWVIVSMHWGGEYEGGPTPLEIDLAYRMVEAGADIIAGHHPHVLQIVRKIKTNDHQTSLVAYSLGNALFDQPTPPVAKQGAVLVVKLGSTGVENVQAVPFTIDPKLGKVNIASPEETQQILEKLDFKLDSVCGCN